MSLSAPTPLLSLFAGFVFSSSALLGCGDEAEPLTSTSADRSMTSVDQGSGPRSLEDAARLYVGSCELCHGERGVGGSSPPIDGAALEGRPDTEIFLEISRGTPGAMPAFGGSLSDEEIRALITYLRSL